jgi:hypothetical protein
MVTKNDDGKFYEIIDEYEYRFSTWGAQKAVEVGMQLASLASGPAEAFGGAVNEEGESLNLGGTIAAAFKAIGQHKADSVDIIKTLSTYHVERRVHGAEEAMRGVGSFDVAYMGRLSHLRKVVTTAAEVQFGDFFSEIGADLNKRGALRPKQDAKKTTSKEKAA